MDDQAHQSRKWCTVARAIHIFYALGFVIIMINNAIIVAMLMQLNESMVRLLLCGFTGLMTIISLGVIYVFNDYAAQYQVKYPYVVLQNTSLEYIRKWWSKSRGQRPLTVSKTLCTTLYLAVYLYMQLIVIFNVMVIGLSASNLHHDWHARDTTIQNLERIRAEYKETLMETNSLSHGSGGSEHTQYIDSIYDALILNVYKNLATLIVTIGVALLPIVWLPCMLFLFPYYATVLVRADRAVIEEYHLA